MDTPLGMYYILQPNCLLATHEPLGRLRTSDNFFFRIKHTVQIVRVNLFQDTKYEAKVCTSQEKFNQEK